jgi:hypothetical protein
MYKHHILSIILIIIGFLPMFILEIRLNIGMFKTNNYEYLFDILFCALEHIGFSIGEILCKIAFNKALILPEKLIFYRGVITLLIHCFIICPILYFSGQIDLYKNIIQYLSDYSLLTTLLLLLSFFFIFFENIITMKVIYFYTPIHTNFLNSIFLCSICMIYYLPIEELTLLRIILYAISLMLIIFGALVFCEIVIINKCGFNNHTKYGSLEPIKIDRDTLDEEPENVEIIEDNIENTTN